MLILMLFSLQPNACATFNFLCHEGRVTGAALIPPPGETALASLGQASE
jgi:NADH dehydrogenase [ubiquinone] 1 alpha subcomplex assembly factor 3